MNEIQNEEYSSRNNLYEVLSGNKKIIYGFTSNVEKDRIEEEYPDKFVLKNWIILIWKNSSSALKSALSSHQRKRSC